MYVLEATNLVKRYGPYTAVAGVTFAVKQGECFGFLGANGAGKTSTLKMIACVSPVTEGILLVNGWNVTVKPREIKATVGVVPQDDNLDEDLNVLQNLLAHARYFDMPKPQREARAMEVLGFMELDGQASRPIDTLSGGMKRRLLIARALLNNPSLLILDEPTSGLDPHARHLVWRRLKALKSQGTTMVLSTHYMEEAALLCDRLAIMDGGRFLIEGTPEEVVTAYRQTNLEAVFLLLAGKGLVEEA